MTDRDTAHRNPAARWLTLIGIGEDGLDGLGAQAKQLIANAEFVFGGRRHLDLAASLIRGKARPWPTPFDTTMADVLRLRGRAVCVLASGDPFLHGVGVTLTRHLDASEVTTIPAPSAFSLAAARLGWPLSDIETVSLHGHPLGLLRPLLHPGRRILALTSDGGAPATIAAYLSGLGFGSSRVHILQALGGPREAVRTLLAASMGTEAFDPLNLVAIEVASRPDAMILPLAPGLPDALFENDGQITKCEIRALTLSALAPRRGELLWDIGAGSGSIAIEWMLAHPSLHAIAIEADAARADRIRRNAAALGTPHLRIVEGQAPQALAGLPAPDAVFIGGGGSKAGVTEAAMAALPAGGRLVANAVTLEMEAVLLSLHARHGGGLTRIALSHATPIGSMTGWKPARAITRWAWVRT